MTEHEDRNVNAYTRIVEAIFLNRYQEGDSSVVFERSEIITTAERLGIRVPRNLGDLLYSFRYRRGLPRSISSTAMREKEWAIFPAGRSVYEFKQVRFSTITPNHQLTRIKIPDATPGAIDMYALGDEQALLAILRYNRLLDIFTGLTCYSLQNHLRTSIPIWNPLKQRNDNTQVETDELYVGINKNGVHYALPIEAKGPEDTHNIIQLWQNVKVCKSKFPDLPVRCVAAQTISDSGIALIEIDAEELDDVAVVSEVHYQLVPPNQMSAKDIRRYQTFQST